MAIARARARANTDEKPNNPRIYSLIVSPFLLFARESTKNLYNASRAEIRDPTALRTSRLDSGNYSRENLLHSHAA